MIPSEPCGPTSTSCPPGSRLANDLRAANKFDRPASHLLRIRDRLARVVEGSGVRRRREKVTHSGVTKIIVRACGTVELGKEARGSDPCLLRRVLSVDFDGYY